MAKLRDDLKAQLMATGKWADFVRFRDELKAQGMSPTKAIRAACAQFFDNAPSVPGQSGGRVKPPVPREPKVAKSVARRKTPAAADEPPVVAGGIPTSLPSGDVEPGVGPQSPQSPSPPPPPTVKGGGVDMPPPLPPVTLADFEGRSSSEVDVIRWVARNMEVVDPDVAGCPDPTAWALLAHCRRSFSVMAEFWKFTYPKLLPSRSQLEAQSDVKDDDGGRAAGVIAELLGISAGVRGAASE